MLDVENNWALCVELPDGIGLGPVGSTAIMISSDGLTITVIDYALGAKVDVTRRPELGRYGVTTLIPLD